MNNKTKFLPIGLPSLQFRTSALKGCWRREERALARGRRDPRKTWSKVIQRLIGAHSATDTPTATSSFRHLRRPAPLGAPAVHYTITGVSISRCATRIREKDDGGPLRLEGSSWAWTDGDRLIHGSNGRSLVTAWLGSGLFLPTTRLCRDLFLMYFICFR